MTHTGLARLRVADIHLLMTMTGVLPLLVATALVLTTVNALLHLFLGTTMTARATDVALLPDHAWRTILRHVAHTMTLMTPVPHHLLVTMMIRTWQGRRMVVLVPRPGVVMVVMIVVVTGRGYLSHSSCRSLIFKAPRQYPSCYAWHLSV